MTPADDSFVPTVALSLGPAAFPVVAARYLEQNRQKIRIAVESLGDEALSWRPGGRVNPIGNLLLHLAGNLSLWILGGLGGEAVERDRSGEFTAAPSGTASEQLARFEAVVRRAEEVVRRIDEDDLARVGTVQGYTVDGFGILFHAVEHMAYHTGQILTLTKARLDPGRQLEFYPQHAGE